MAPDVGVVRTEGHQEVNQGEDDQGAAHRRHDEHDLHDTQVRDAQVVLSWNFAYK